MFVNVKPFFFHSLVHTDADQFVYYLNNTKVITALNTIEMTVAAI